MKNYHFPMVFLWIFPHSKGFSRAAANVRSVVSGLSLQGHLGMFLDELRHLPMCLVVIWEVCRNHEKQMAVLYGFIMS